MANLSKIKVGETSYNIVPQLGKGLKENEGVISLSTGNGIVLNENEELAVNAGAGLAMDSESGKIVVSLGKAADSDNAQADTGIEISNGTFSINPASFKAYLQSLGVVFG